MERLDVRERVATPTLKTEAGLGLLIAKIFVGRPQFETRMGVRFTHA